MAFGTLLWKSVIFTSAALLRRDLAGIGSAPRDGFSLQIKVNLRRGIMRR